MEFTTKTPNQFTDHDIDQLAHLAGIGFGQGDTPAMRQDTMQHIADSDTIQLAHDEEQLVAFSMTRRCLWRACY